MGLSVRVTVAALLALALAQSLALPLPLWAVLTAIVVTQTSVGKSLKATADYLSGTVVGAVYAALAASVVPHAGEIGLLLLLAIAVAPLALVATLAHRLNTAPITAAIVILVPAITHASPVGSAIDRLLEVALGGATGFAVSFVILPSNAHRLVAEAAARTLGQMADALRELLAGLNHGLNKDALPRILGPIGQAVIHLDGIGAEAERERAARLAAGPDTGPLLRTLLRLRHDLVMIGRAALMPLPPAFQGRLAGPLAGIAAVFGHYLTACGAALSMGRAPPSLDGVDLAVAAYTTEVAALRSEGQTLTLPGDRAEHLFALGFALEQMHQNLRDLHYRVAEWTGPKMKRLPL